MADESLERRMEELRRMGLTEQQIIDLVNREIVRSLEKRRPRAEADSPVASARSIGRSPAETAPEDPWTDGDSDGCLDSSLTEAEPGDTGRLDPAPPKVQQTHVLSLLQERRSMTVSGPLPPPEWAERYEGVLPGFLDRQVRLQERQADQTETRLEIARAAVDSQNTIKQRGQLFAAVVAFGFLCVASILGYSDPWAGVAVAAFDVSALVGAFVFSRYTRSPRGALRRGRDEDDDVEDGGRNDDDFD